MPSGLFRTQAQDKLGDCVPKFFHRKGGIPEFSDRWDPAVLDVRILFPEPSLHESCAAKLTIL